MIMEGRNIDRKSSIESEPRTLTMKQIRFAREAALYILQTSSMEEAMRIFTEGLEPVISTVKGINDESEKFDLEEDNHHLLDELELRDVATAPF